METLKSPTIFKVLNKPDLLNDMVIPVFASTLCVYDIIILS